jgi:hypothetical protein
LDAKALKYESDAAQKLAQGKIKQAEALQKQADKLQAEAAGLRDKALVYSDLSQVLKISIDLESQLATIAVDEENDTDEKDTMFQ